MNRNLASAEEWIVMLSTPCNSWIFYTRIRAVYHDSRLIKWTFFALWSATLVTLGIPLTVDPTVAISPTFKDGITSNYGHKRRLAILTLCTLTLFDTAVMVAISIRMVSYSLSDSWKSKIYSLIFGNEMGHTSRLFLRSSQMYYLWALFYPLITLKTAFLIIMNLTSPVVLVQLCYFGILLAPQPDALVLAIGIFHAVFHNMMTCRVYRMMKIEYNAGLTTVHTNITPIAFRVDYPDSQIVSVSTRACSASGG